MPITKADLDAVRSRDPHLDLMLDAIAAGLVALGRPNRDALDLVERYFLRWSVEELELVFQEEPWSWAGRLHFWELDDRDAYTSWRASAEPEPPAELEVLRLRVRYFRVG